MNIYEVTLSTETRYRGGGAERKNQSLKVSAENGDDAVAKAKVRLRTFEPILEGLALLVSGVD
jgi:hypothetical protein